VITSNPPALQLYTVRELLPAHRRQVLSAVAAVGYGAAEPFGILRDTAGLAGDLAAAGLACCGVHATPEGDDAEAVVAAASILGADTIIVPYLAPGRFADADGVRAVAAELTRMAARLADRGMRLGYHNHDFELATLIGGRPALEVLADALGGSVLLEVDTYWAAVGQAAAGGPTDGSGVPDLLRRLGERVRYLHVKDGPITRDDPMTAVGGGRMPVADILAACPSAQWHVVELDHCATDMLTAVGESLAWLAGQGLASPVTRSDAQPAAWAPTPGTGAR
jgi:sugar phosphate isomerase/epimerase